MFERYRRLSQEIRGAAHAAPCEPIFVPQLGVCAQHAGQLAKTLTMATTRGPDGNDQVLDASTFVERVLTPAPFSRGHRTAECRVAISPKLGLEVTMWGREAYALFLRLECDRGIRRYAMHPTIDAEFAAECITYHALAASEDQSRTAAIHYRLDRAPSERIVSWVRELGVTWRPETEGELELCTIVNDNRAKIIALQNLAGHIGLICFDLSTIGTGFSYRTF